MPHSYQGFNQEMQQHLSSGKAEESKSPNSPADQYGAFASLLKQDGMINNDFILPLDLPNQQLQRRRSDCPDSKLLEIEKKAESSPSKQSPLEA